MDGGTWSPASRNQYNLMDAISRSTTQVINLSLHMKVETVSYMPSKLKN